MILRLALAGAVLFADAAAAHASNWTLTHVSNVPLPAPASGIVQETSCVTYVGPVDGAHRFISAQQNHGNIVRFDVQFTDLGAIASIANVVNIPIVDLLDFEGVAYTSAARNSVFVSEENNPGVREVNLATGTTLQTVSIPSVFGSRRSNRGFESLTRSLDGTTMWTGNEEALTVDGPASTASVGSTVRLLKLNVAGNAVSAGSQYAYQISPIHSANNASRSGLNDLAIMPDGTLLALERSATNTEFFNRIFEIDFTGATDVSVGATATGLIGKSYTPVGKSLLWSGTINPPGGQNLEGLGLGPRLPDGSWAMLGVIDSSEGGADNTVVAFRAMANVSADFNDDGAVDGSDYLHWQRGLGIPVGAKHAEGDADRDGDVDADDLHVWTGALAEPPVHAVPEPAAWLLTATASLAAVGARRRGASARMPSAGC